MTHFLNTTITENTGTNSTSFDIPATGQTIINKFNANDTLSFNGTSFSGSGYRTTDANNIDDHDENHTWLLKRGGYNTTDTFVEEEFYALYRIDEENYKSATGTRLMIAPVEQGFDVNNNEINTTENCVIINDFPFDQALAEYQETGTPFQL